MNSIKKMRYELTGKKIRDRNETDFGSIIDVYRKDRKNFVISEYYGSLRVHIPLSSIRKNYIFI